MPPPQSTQRTRQRERGERKRKRVVGDNLRQIIWHAVPEISRQEP